MSEAKDEKISTEEVVRDIRCQTWKKYGAEEKIGIVLKGLRAEGGVQASPVVPAFQIGNKFGTRHLPRRKAIISALGLEGADTAFHQRVVIRVSGATH